MAEPSVRGDPNALYALGQNPEESARLQRQADELAPESTMVLDRASLGRGQSAVDLGCGPRGVLDLLATRVGPDGRVVGIDADPALVAMATEFAAGRGLGNVEVRRADARETGLASGSFDVVHARALLVTVPEPAVVAAEMTRLARPGGWVASVEPDTQFTLCYPASGALDRISAFFPPVFRRNGADPRPSRPGTVPTGRAGGHRRAGHGPGLPGRAHPTDHPARPPQEHPPAGRGDGVSERRGTRRVGRRSPRPPRRSRHRGRLRAALPHMGTEAWLTSSVPARAYSRDEGRDRRDHGPVSGSFASSGTPCGGFSQPHNAVGDQAGHPPALLRARGAGRPGGGTIIRSPAPARTLPGCLPSTRPQVALTVKT